MNYLAHLHISDLTNTSASGSLLGDFVKGNVNKLPFNYDVKVGVHLHRKVDSFTDQHPYVSQLKTELGEWRRYSGIILDVLFDHQLANRFDQFHQQSLSSFAKKIYKQLDTDNEHYSDRYKRIVTGMKTGDWLTGYQHIENISRALEGIGTRFKRQIPLHHSITWYQNQGDVLEQGFESFYLELISYARLEAKKLQVAELL